jgi:TatA/E family protein of Tat protein translocase
VVGIENPVHLLFIAVVALLVLGPKRLPELARAVGRGVREFREAISTGSSADEAPLSAESQEPAAPPAEALSAPDAAPVAVPTVPAEPHSSGEPSSGAGPTQSLRTDG